MTKRPKLLEMESLDRAAACLKVLAHPVRLRMVDILLQGEFPVHRVAELVELPPAQACEHLRLMQSHGLLTGIRRGRTVYYRVANPSLPGIMECVRRSCRP
jgi:ArsR family transcriptional regulator, zinc-responsive transcriptional repressor